MVQLLRRRCTSHRQMALKVVLLWAVALIPGVSGSLRGFNDSNQTEQNETHLTLRSSSQGSQYWDGQCSACPAYLYPWMHCKAGGRPKPGFRNSKPCPKNAALCQAKCVRPDTPRPENPGPTNGRPNGGDGGQVQPEIYNDGQCTPCPAFLYSHCRRGGRLISAKPCGWMGIYCEGVCKNPNPKPKPEPEPSKPFEPVVSEPGVKTLYHETSPETAEKILESSFRPGSSGWCGGAIYFYTSPRIPKSKLGPDSQTGAVIQAEVDLGTNIQLDSKCEGADDARKKYDSVSFNPGDGLEYLVFSPDRVISMSRFS